MSLEKKWDTQVGRGLKLSGGEKQRVASLLITQSDCGVDEATSALTRAEKVYNCFRKSSSGSHTVGNCASTKYNSRCGSNTGARDGKIIEKGTHEN